MMCWFWTTIIGAIIGTISPFIFYQNSEKPKFSEREKRNFDPMKRHLLSVNTSLKIKIWLDVESMRLFDSNKLNK